MDRSGMTLSPVRQLLLVLKRALDYILGAVKLTQAVKSVVLFC